MLELSIFHCLVLSWHFDEASGFVFPGGLAHFHFSCLRSLLVRVHLAIAESPRESAG